MANSVKEIVAKGKSNILGGVLGAVAGYLVAKKLVKTTNNIT